MQAELKQNQASLESKSKPNVEKDELGRVGRSGTRDVAALGLHGCTCAEQVGVTVGCNMLVCASNGQTKDETHHRRAL